MLQKQLQIPCLTSIIEILQPQLYIKIPKAKMLAIKNLFRNFSTKLNPRLLDRIDDYQITHLLGKGSSSRVFHGIHLLSEQRVSIKIFKKSIPKDQVQKEIEINVKMLQNLPEDHKNIKFLHLLSTIYDKNTEVYTLIYRFNHGVTLGQMITGFTHQQSLKMMFTLANTLKYVHSLGYIHRDIKPANVLVTPQGAKLFDFGLVKDVPQQGLKINNFGTKCYKCPQVVYRMQKYDQKADIWGLGIIFAQLLLKKKHILRYQTDQYMLGQMASFCGLHEEDMQCIPEQFHLYAKTVRSYSWLHMASELKIDKSLAQLVNRMLHINPSKRPKLDEIVSHKVFSNIA